MTDEDLDEAWRRINDRVWLEQQLQLLLTLRYLSAHDPWRAREAGAPQSFWERFPSPAAACS
jgi:hypothetical protein